MSCLVAEFVVWLRLFSVAGYVGGEGEVLTKLINTPGWVLFGAGWGFHFGRRRREY